jgi:hypothetical protein
MSTLVQVAAGSILIAFAWSISTVVEVHMNYEELITLLTAKGSLWSRASLHGNLKIIYLQTNQ